jgi:prevent-host-death family protein
VHVQSLVDRFGGWWVRRIPVSALRERLGGVLKHVAVRREPIILTRHGHDLGAIVPMEDLERLRALDAEESGARMAPYRSSWRRLTDSMHRRP